MIILDIYGSHFEYRGVRSELYDLVFATIETERYEDKMTGASSVTVYNKRTRRKYLIDTDYSESCVTFDVELVRCDGRTLSRRDMREISKWLFDRHDYGILYPDISADDNAFFFEHDPDNKFILDEYSTDSQRRMYMNCRFMNPKEIYGIGGVIGYRATVETDSPYLWQEEVGRTFDISNSYVEKTIRIDTAPGTYVYPRIEVTTSDTETAGYNRSFPIEDLGGFTKPYLYFDDANGVLAEFTPDDEGEMPAAAKDHAAVFINASPLLHFSVSIPTAYGVNLRIMRFACTEAHLKAGHSPRHYTPAEGETDEDAGVTRYVLLTEEDTRFVGILMDKSGAADGFWDEVIASLRVRTDAHNIEFRNLDDTGDYMRVENVACGSELVVDGNTNYVSPEWARGFSHRGFPRLIDGENRLRLLGRPGDVMRIFWSTRRMP